jgi:hypothetical protein
MATLCVFVIGRSLEIFGDEKALDRLVLTSLFGSGRLDFWAIAL